jgi:hypothetical protein
MAKASCNGIALEWTMPAAPKIAATTRASDGRGIRTGCASIKMRFQIDEIAMQTTAASTNPTLAFIIRSLLVAVLNMGLFQVFSFLLSYSICFFNSDNKFKASSGVRRFKSTSRSCSTTGCDSAVKIVNCVAGGTAPGDR